MSRRARRTVCWVCGEVARRRPEPVDDPGVWMGPPGRVRVIGRGRTPRAYGPCRRFERLAAIAGSPLVVQVFERDDGSTVELDCSPRCDGTMLRPRDAAYVRRAALEHERHGGNVRSEYDYAPDDDRDDDRDDEVPR